MDSLTGPGLVKPNLSLGSDNESKVMTKDGKVTTPHRWLWSGINAVMAVFFALAAFVQVQVSTFYCRGQADQNPRLKLRAQFHRAAKHKNFLSITFIP